MRSEGVRGQDSTTRAGLADADRGGGVEDDWDRIPSSSVFMRFCSEGATGMTVCGGKENKALEVCIVGAERGRAEGTAAPHKKRGPTHTFVRMTPQQWGEAEARSSVGHSEGQLGTSSHKVQIMECLPLNPHSSPV